MNDTVKILLGLLGGLTIFIFGMNMMSECLQKAAGEKMKKILSLLTKNPVLGVLAGALTTAVLQSSSATTVMAIGFVSAGLMSLPQAISIILGANIGTTMTAQIIAFKITDYIYLFIAVGFLISFVSKKEKVKNIGQTIFAFGLLFEGIETMGHVMKPLASSSVFTDLISKVAGIPVFGVVLGTVMTLIVQSSSATIAVLQNFASQAGADGTTSIIGLAGAIPILLGDNIGTTITALLASVGQSKDAKRTAVAHSVFNISGALLFIWFVKPYASLVQYLSPKGAEIEVISRQIANAHTGFNITMTLIWLPLIAVLVKIVTKIIPDKKEEYVLLPGATRYLDEKILNQPAAALHLVSKEVLRCGHMVEEMLAKVYEFSEKNKELLLSEIEKDKTAVRELYVSINDYLNVMFSEGVMTEEQAGESTRLMYILCDVDRIGYLCNEITATIIEPDTANMKLSKEATKDLKKSVKLIHDMYEYAKTFEQLMGELEPHGVRIINFNKLSEKEGKFLENYFDAHIAPFLSPMIIGKQHPFPFLTNKDLYAIVLLSTAKGKSKIGIVPCKNSVFKRLIEIPTRPGTFMLSEELILHFIWKLYAKYTIREKAIMRVTRNADIDANEMYDEDMDYRNVMEKLIKKRTKLTPVRVELSRKINDNAKSELSNYLEVGMKHFIDVGTALDLSFVLKWLFLL